MIVDLVIPARDELANIEPLFEELAPLRDAGIIRHVVVGDNGSRDGTGAAAAGHGAVVVPAPDVGYGNACLAALAWIEAQPAPPDVVAFIDADRSDDPAGLPDLLAALHDGRGDIVIGSRVRNAVPGALNVVQRFGNRLACTLMAVLGGQRYGDLGPFRALRWTTFRRLGMADRTWGWTVEMQMKAALLAIPVCEVDVHYRRRGAGRSKISGTVRGVVTAGTKIITTIGVLWWRRGALRRDDAEHFGA